MRIPQVIVTVVGLCVGSCLCQAQPYVASVVNSASYSGSQIAQGSIFTVFGFDLGPGQLQQATSYPLPFQINGISINVAVGATVLTCPMIYASYGQASAILPSNSPIGNAAIVVKNRNLSSYPISIQVASSSFGAYTVNSAGMGPGIITGSDYVVKTFSQSARVGETLILWGTGLGATTGPDNTVPQTGKQFSDVEVFVGNVSAPIAYAGRSGCCAGLDQIAFVVPSTSLGCFVPIAVRTGRIVVSNFTTLPVAASGGQCSSATPGIPTSVLASALAGKTLKFGAIAIGPIAVLQGAGFSFSQGIADQLSTLLHRSVSESDVRKMIHAYRDRDSATIKRTLAKYGIGARQLHGRLLRTVQRAISIDQQGAAAAFGSYRTLASFSPEFAANFTSVGTCTVTNGIAASTSEVRSSSLDAGSGLSFVGPLGAYTITRISNGQYQTSLGSGFTSAEIPTGTYTISGSGGQDVPPFSASLNVTSSLSWTNKSSLAIVDRAEPLTFTWSGGSNPGYVLIGGSVHTTGENTAFLCVEDAQKGTFTVPSFVLSALPPADASDAYFFIAPHPFSNPVSITGLDLAYIANGSSDYKSVSVQ